MYTILLPTSLILYFRRFSRHYFMSIRSSSCITAAPTGPTFVKFVVGDFHENVRKKFQYIYFFLIGQKCRALNLKT